ncbi:MAG: penicillin-binding protein 2 [Steroidobacteraceae bacterium]
MALVKVKDYWLEQRQFERRALAAAAIVTALMLTLAGRLVLLQIVRHNYYTELSQGNRVRTEPLPAPRGIIFDRAGAVLAENTPAYQLELVREQVPDLNGTLRRLAALGFITADDLEDVRKQILSRRSFDSVPVKLRMNEDEIARFAVRRFQFPGVDIRTRLARSYPNGDLAVHALGYVAAISESDLAKIDRAAYSGTSLIGRLGVEAAYEKQLHGYNGAREVLVNAQGRSVQRQGAFTPKLRTISPAAGDDLVLSIDLKVQRVAEAALAGKRGAIVALDPANGNVIALVSRPGFDPTMFGRGVTRAEYQALQEDIDKPLFNRALRGTYPPGSTIKPVVALAGLSYGAIDAASTKYCRGFFQLPGSSHRFRDWKPAGHGTVAMRDAIAQSCDVYFYQLAEAIGASRLAEFLAHFGLGRPTGVDIGGEKPGLLPSPEWKRQAYKRPEDQAWFPGETLILGIGQGYLLVTPMQLAHLASVIASRGRSWQPRLVTAVRNPATGKITALPPKLLEEIDVSEPEEWQVAIDGMVAVTTRGTARSAIGTAPYSIAGKTGTAQVFSISQNEKYDEKTLSERLYDHGWFIAFAPAENPKIALAVLIENGKHGTAAAKLARLVLDAYLTGKAELKPEPAAGAAGDE